MYQHKQNDTIRICQDHGMLIWHVRSAHPVTVFKQLFAAFTGCFPETWPPLKLQQFVCEDATGVQMPVTHWDNTRKGILSCWKSYSYSIYVFKGPDPCCIWGWAEKFWTDLTSEYEFRRNTETVYHSFFVVLTLEAVAACARYCRKKRCLLSLVPFFWLCLRLICVTIVNVICYKVIFTRHLPQVSSDTCNQLHKDNNHHVYYYN